MIEFEGEKYYNVQEIAEYLHCTRGTIQNKISAGKIQGEHFGRMKYYTEKQVKDIRQVILNAKKQ